jgi:hypothetical protein
MLIVVDWVRKNESWGNFIAQNKFGRPSNEMVIEDQEEQSTKNITNNYDEDLGSSGAEGFISIPRKVRKSKTSGKNSREEIFT